MGGFRVIALLIVAFVAISFADGNTASTASESNGLSTTKSKRNLSSEGAIKLLYRLKSKVEKLSKKVDSLNHKLNVQKNFRKQLLRSASAAAAAGRYGTSVSVAASRRLNSGSPVTEKNGLRKARPYKPRTKKAHRPKQLKYRKQPALYRKKRFPKNDLYKKGGASVAVSAGGGASSVSVSAARRSD